MPAVAKAKTRAGAHDAIRLDVFLPYCFALLAHRLGLGAADLHARQHRVTVQEWKVLSIVADGGPVTPHEIRRRGTQDKSTISWAVKRLKRRGLVATEPRPRDGRTFEVAMTDEGWRFYGALAPEARRRAARAFAVLSAAERRTLQCIVTKLLSGA
jgi:DNA-binding MarR family transcriptional regulator